MRKRIKSEKYIRFDKFTYNQFREFIIYTTKVFKPDLVTKFDRTTSFSDYVRDEQDRMTYKLLKLRLNWDSLLHILEFTNKFSVLNRKKRFKLLWKDVCACSGEIIMQDDNKLDTYEYKIVSVYYDFNNHRIKIEDPVLDGDLSMHQYVPTSILDYLNYYRSTFYFADGFFKAWQEYFKILDKKSWDDPYFTPRVTFEKYIPKNILNSVNIKYEAKHEY